MEKLKENLYKRFRNEVKAISSWGGDYSIIFREYGFTGPFSGLDEYYNESEMIELLDQMEQDWKD